MVERDAFFTYEGLKKVETELDQLKTVGRKEVAERIKEARGFGDLSENAEYDEAKNEQAKLEERINKLENMLRNAKIIDEDELPTDAVSVGSTVILYDVEFEEEVEYSIVGSVEADPFEGKISNESPLGSALIGARKGETIDVQTPDGLVQYKVIDIDR